ncbi:MAG: zf-HC2 domain-containing protein [Chloroflexota bacterium]|jgi:predicted anti-sigma-YlaC factor YlaD
MAEHKHDCQHLLGDLSDYLDGEASDELCAEIEQHMANCEDCRIVVDTLGKTVRLYHDLPRPSLPADARERLYHSLDLDTYL